MTPTHDGRIQHRPAPAPICPRDAKPASRNLRSGCEHASDTRILLGNNPPIALTALDGEGGWPASRTTIA